MSVESRNDILVFTVQNGSCGGFSKFFFSKVQFLTVGGMLISKNWAIRLFANEILTLE
jgi:hypothetical protein